MVDRRILQKRQASSTGDDEPPSTTRSSSATSSSRPSSSARPSSASPSAASSSRRSSSSSSSSRTASVASSSSEVSSSSAPSSTVTSSTTTATPTTPAGDPTGQDDGGIGVVTITHTITPTPTSSGRAAAASTGGNGFFDNKAAVGATFAIVGLAVIAIIGVLVAVFIRRRRAKKFDREVSAVAAAAAAVQNPFAFDDDDRSHSNASQGALYGTPLRHREQQEQFARYGDAYGMRQIDVEPPPVSSGIAGFGAASAVRRSRTAHDRERAANRTSHPTVVESEEEDRYDSQAQLRYRAGPPSASSQGPHENFSPSAYETAAYQVAAAAARSSSGHGHSERAIPSSIISPTSLAPPLANIHKPLPNPHPPQTPPYPRRSLDDPGQNPFAMPVPQGSHTPETQSVYSRPSFERDQDRRMHDLRFSAFGPPSVPDGGASAQGRR